MFHATTLFCPDSEDVEHDRARQIVEEAESQLWRTGHPCARDIECSYNVDDGTLIIAGRVHSYYMKQTAQTVLRAIEGVERVINCLEVIPSNSRRPTRSARDASAVSAPSDTTPIVPRTETICDQATIANLSQSEIAALASEELVDLIRFMQPRFCSQELLAHLPYYDRAMLERLTYLVREVCRRLMSRARHQPEDVARF